MATKKTTPKSRAAARSSAKRGDALRYTQSQLKRPGKVAEAGVGWGNVVRAATSIARKYEKATEKPYRKLSPSQQEARDARKIQRIDTARAKRSEADKKSLAKMEAKDTKAAAKTAKKASKPKPLTDRQKANIAARKSAARAAKKASGKKK